MTREKLITAVARHPVLYDPTVYAFRDRHKKALAWAEVSRVVGWPAKVCLKKWKGLRDTYRNFKKKEKQRRKNGAGAGGGKTWQFARIISFIDPFMEDRHSDSNVVEPGPGPSSESDSDSEHEEAATADPAAGNPAQAEDQAAGSATQPEDRASGQGCQGGERSSPQTGGGGCSRSCDLEEKLITALLAVSNRPAAPPEDSDSLFFRSLLEDFRTLSARTRQYLKFEMHRMVYEAKCREVEPWAEGGAVQLTTL